MKPPTKLTVLDAVLRAQHRLSTAQVANLAGRNDRATVRKELTALAEAGRIHRDGDGILDMWSRPE